MAKWIILIFNWVRFSTCAFLLHLRKGFEGVLFLQPGVSLFFHKYPSFWLKYRMWILLPPLTQNSWKKEKNTKRQWGKMAFQRSLLFRESQLMAAPENLAPALALYGPLMLAIKRSCYICVCLNTQRKETLFGGGGGGGEDSEKVTRSIRSLARTKTHLSPIIRTVFFCLRR